MPGRADSAYTLFSRCELYRSNAVRPRGAPGSGGGVGVGDLHLVGVAPSPVLVRLKGLHDGMAGRVEVPRGVAVGRAVAAADMAARLAHAQVYPAAAQLEALDAAVAARARPGDRVREFGPPLPVRAGPSGGRVARVADRGKARVSVVSVAALVGARRSDAKAGITSPTAPRITMASLIAEVGAISMAMALLCHAKKKASA